VDDGRVLGQNGNTALFFERVRVHDADVDVLTLSENAALLEHGVNEGGLPVVDMGDDCDVAQV
jgi:hypothetical protein